MDDYMPIVIDSLDVFIEEHTMAIRKTFDCSQYINHPDGWYRKFDKHNGKRNLRSK
jgi:hypothetical protein